MAAPADDPLSALARGEREERQREAHAVGAGCGERKRLIVFALYASPLPPPEATKGAIDGKPLTPEVRVVCVCVCALEREW
jgi:hypothetical protein